MSKKRYAVGCTAPEDWTFIHEELSKDGSLEDNIPSESITVDDLKEHSGTRAVYMLTDDEAADLRKHPKVLYADEAKEDFSPPADELMAEQTFRYAQTSKHHRDYYELPTTVTDDDLRRAGYQVYRHSQQDDPWPHNSAGDNTVLNNRVLHEGDGKHVDLIVCDEGCWFGHVEFQTDATGGGPDNYQDGNVLTRSGVSTTSGTCDLCDLILEAPYYIDPDFFNASPGTRLETRWDGTTVPVESVARNWWRFSSASYRSVGFTTFGTANVSTSYSRAYCNGDNDQLAQNGSYHGTQCMGASCGKTQGWAFNANKWNLNLYGSYGSGIEAGFDAQKLFHQMKPTNPKYGTQDPTVSSNSWGYRAVPEDEAYYYYRGDTNGVSYTIGGNRSPYNGSNTKPGFMKWVGYYGDSYRMKGQLFPGSMTQAADELIESGVIFVGAAGNSNQKQVSWDHPDFDNYWNTGAGVTVGSGYFTEFGLQKYPYTNRRGFPQHAGMSRSGVGGSEYTYPVINIGALDDQYGTYDGSYKERKVSYSDMGSEIDCFASADGIVTAGNQNSGAIRRDTFSGSSSYSSWYDIRFSGTSAACPVAAGIIATKMQYNRDWTWQDVRKWLRGQDQPVGIATVGLVDSSEFYHGVDSGTANAASWSTVNSLEGAFPAIIWDAPTGGEDQTFETPGFKTISGEGMKFKGGGLKIVYRS